MQLFMASRKNYTTTRFKRELQRHYLTPHAIFYYTTTRFKRELQQFKRFKEEVLIIPQRDSKGSYNADVSGN